MPVQWRVAVLSLSCRAYRVQAATLHYFGSVKEQRLNNSRFLTLQELSPYAGCSLTAQRIAAGQGIYLSLTHHRS